MIRTTRHGDVVQFEMSSRQSRLLGFSVSAYLVRGVLVDTGFPLLRDEFVQVIDPARLRGAMITHKHEDHAGNVGALVDRGVPVTLAAETRRALEAPTRIGFYRRWTWGASPALRRDLSPFSPQDLRFVPTPGHSADHHVVWDPGEGTLFGGDLFVGVKVRVAHPGEDLRETLRSLRRAIALEPKRLFDAHRGLVLQPVALLKAKVQWMEDTIGAIEVRHAAGTPEADILRSVMGGEALTGYVSRGDYSRRNFVRSVLATIGAPAT